MQPRDKSSFTPLRRAFPLLAKCWSLEFGVSALPMLADYHTHTPLCHHAVGSPTEYAAQAKAAGLAELGLSDHNPMPEQYDDWRMALADFPTYLDLVEQARADHPDLPIRLGLECDFIEGYEPWIEQQAQMAPFDYLIGSVHYVSSDFAVDDPKHLSRWRAEGAVEDIWRRYWMLYEKMVRTQLFDFHAHPDLPKKFGLRPAGDLRRYYEPVIQALADTRGVMEVSTAGLRKECAELYPAQDFLMMAQQAGVQIVISSDAHAPGEVGLQFDRALQAVRAAGFTHTVRCHQRSRTLVPLPETWPASA
jgi:histidinol-phosphatase (PHP family)